MSNEVNPPLPFSFRSVEVDAAIRSSCCRKIRGFFEAREGRHLSMISFLYFHIIHLMLSAPLPLSLSLCLKDWRIWFELSFVSHHSPRLPSHIPPRISSSCSIQWSRLQTSLVLLVRRPLHSVSRPSHLVSILLLNLEVYRDLLSKSLPDSLRLNLRLKTEAIDRLRKVIWLKKVKIEDLKQSRDMDLGTFALLAWVADM